MVYPLGSLFPGIATSLPRATIADLPTPVSRHILETKAGKRTVFVKHDEKTNSVYGGNKVRKLEYLLQRALERGARRVATFGAAGSNHALATAVHARGLELDCTCFLAHQIPTPQVPRTLARHLDMGTEIVRYGGGVDNLTLFRRYLQHRNTWVIPLGGTCWYGAVGFVNAGLELALQIDAGDLESPARVYVANGTMGSVAGLALGLALADVETDVHAVRVASNRFSNPAVLSRLARKTALMLRRLDAGIPADLADRTRIVWRNEYFAGGYALANEATLEAVSFAQTQLSLTLETTYTGKAMAALLDDACDRPVLFWNTYHPLQLTRLDDNARQRVPEEFRRYFDAEIASAHSRPSTQ